MKAKRTFALSGKEHFFMMIPVIGEAGFVGNNFIHCKPGKHTEDQVIFLLKLGV